MQTVLVVHTYADILLARRQNLGLLQALEVWELAACIFDDL